MAVLRDRSGGGEGAPPPWLARPAPAVLAWLPSPTGSREAGSPRSRGARSSGHFPDSTGPEPLNLGPATAPPVRNGRDDLVTAAFAAWTEPTPWQTRPYGVVDEQAVT